MSKQLSNKVHSYKGFEITRESRWSNSVNRWKGGTRIEAVVRKDGDIVLVVEKVKQAKHMIDNPELYYATRNNPAFA